MRQYCSGCGDKLSEELIRHKALYCSDKCARKTSKEEILRLNKGVGEQSSSSVGAAHELLVCSVLLKNGYHVFRAQSPSCPCDLIALKQEEIFMVEVTTGTRLPNGYSYPKHTNGRYRFDWIAIVFHDNTVIWKDANGEFLLS